jgi:hypothetical protein
MNYVPVLGLRIYETDHVSPSAQIYFKGDHLLNGTDPVLAQAVASEAFKIQSNALIIDFNGDLPLYVVRYKVDAQTVPTYGPDDNESTLIAYPITALEYVDASTQIDFPAGIGGLESLMNTHKQDYSPYCNTLTLKHVRNY